MPHPVEDKGLIFSFVQPSFVAEENICPMGAVKTVGKVARAVNTKLPALNNHITLLTLLVTGFLTNDYYGGTNA